MPDTLDILCLGDSLTQGFHHFGRGESPYSTKLKRVLKDTFSDRVIRVRTSGVPGDLASASPFEGRLRQELEANSYDWVIILGGTNDLARLIAVDKIYDALKSHWNRAMANGCRVLALTIPECKARPEWLLQNRSELNQRILAHTAPNFYTLDLHANIPYHSLSDADRKRYWYDGLHLTADGYEWMGEHIANRLTQVLQREGL